MDGFGSTIDGRLSPVSATTPPTPDGEDWTVDYASSNGARAQVRSDSAHRLVVLGYITAVASNSQPRQIQIGGRIVF